MDEQNRFAPDGSLQSIVIRGHNPQGDVAETYQVKDGTYTYKTPVDHGEGKTAPDLAYVSFGGTFDSFTFLIDAMLKSPDHSIRLLPSGTGHIAPLAELDVTSAKGEKKHLTAYAITGFGLSPFPVWMDGDKFFGTPGVVAFLPEGWESVGASMSKAQDDALSKLAPLQYAAIAKSPAGPVAFTNVKLYDSDARKFRDGMTVIVNNGIVTDEGPSKKIKTPACAQGIDGTGKTLIPGLGQSIRSRDCTSHFSPLSGSGMCAPSLQ